MDGLYEIRYGTGETAVVQTDDFWSKINAFLEIPVPPATSTSAGLKAGLQALGLDADTCATVTERDNIILSL